MRKKTINKIYDYVFYGILYIVPIFVIIISLWKQGDISIYNTFFQSTGIINNVFTNAFNTMFIDYLHFFENTNNILLQIFNYMLVITMLHLLFDIFEFIPKLIRQILKKWGAENE